MAARRLRRLGLRQFWPTLVVALSCLAGRANGYLMGDEADIMCWKKELATNIQEFIGVCPSEIHLEWVVELPVDMLEGSYYTVEYLFSTSMNVSSAPAIPHANLHSCRTENGQCTPNVASTPGLVTHSEALAAVFDAVDGDSSSVLFSSDITLQTGAWTTIAHVRFVSEHAYQYEVAIGTIRDVTKPSVEEKVSDDVMYMIWVLASLAICFSLTLLALTWNARKHPIMRSASVNFCLAIIVSGLLGLTSVFFMHTPTKYGCMLRTWILCFSFTGIFGLLAAKTLRIWIIFRIGSLRVVRVRDSHLWAIFSGLLFLDTLVLLIWTLQDPLIPTRTAGAVEFSYQWECSSEHSRVWSGVLFGMKGVLMGGSVVLAWFTRHVASKFNESKMISFALYSAFVLLSFSIPSQYALRGQPNVAYTMSSVAIIAVVVVTVTVLLLPKLHLIRTLKVEDIASPKGGGKGTLSKISAVTNMPSLVKEAGGRRKKSKPSPGSLRILLDDGAGAGLSSSDAWGEEPTTPLDALNPEKRAKTKYKVSGGALPSKLVRCIENNLQVCNAIKKKHDTGFAVKQADLRKLAGTTRELQVCMESLMEKGEDREQGGSELEISRGEWASRRSPGSSSRAQNNLNTPNLAISPVVIGSTVPDTVRSTLSLPPASILGTSSSLPPASILGTSSVVGGTRPVDMRSTSRYATVT